VSGFAWIILADVLVFRAVIVVNVVRLRRAPRNERPVYLATVLIFLATLVVAVVAFWLEVHRRPA
jgi:hypothetical protein